MKKNIYNPNLVKSDFQSRVSEDVDVVVGGDFDNRVVILHDEVGQQIHGVRKSIQETDFYKLFGDVCQIRSPGDMQSAAVIGDEIVEKLRTPRFTLVQLAKPENFPYPRFSLALGGLAAAIRKNFKGQANLIDMQMGATTEEVIEQIVKDKSHIVGLSATFGQYDLLHDLLKALQQHNMVILVGGSLAALNSSQILNEFPNVIVSLAAGEQTVVDIGDFWRGDLMDLKDVHSIAYNREGHVCHTNKKLGYDKFYVPELDLLDEVLSRSGVMMLETSRGCSFACSFCPRKHKGKWICADSSNIDAVMTGYSEFLHDDEQIVRKVFMVDEEFIGYEDEVNTDQRLNDIAKIMDANGFKFETSSRIDQVYDPKKNEEWHLKRIALWKKLCESGLNRVLFGVESGVSSVLQRFNKRISPEQQVIALRILTALGVPIRVTYITFDPLMDFDELKATYEFLGRRDVFLKKKSNFSSAEILALAANPEEADYKNEPVYGEVSYQLVSLECLDGAPYSNAVSTLGLVKGRILNMGRLESAYIDVRIGKMSKFSQLWIDRLFAFDYALKSFEKVYQDSVSEKIRSNRKLLKSYSYGLLGSMIELVDTGKTVDSITWNGNIEVLDSCLEELLDCHFSAVLNEMRPLLDEMCSLLSSNDSVVLCEVFDRMGKAPWKLINNR